MVKPLDILDFIELPVFTRRWSDLGLDDESDLAALQCMIMEGPKKAPVIKKSKSLRKIRFAPSRWKSGKSGAARIVYVYFEEFGIVLLAICWGKAESGNISDAVLKYLNTLVDEVERELRRRKTL